MSDEKWRVGKRSVSQLESYEKCGHSYYLQRVLKAPQRQAGWFIQGSAVHAAIEAYERSGRALRRSDAVECFNWHWENELALAREKQPSDKMWMAGGKKTIATDLRQRRELGQQQTIDYVEINGLDSRLMPFELVEGEITTEIGFELDFNGVIVLGYIDLILEDRVTGDLVVRDIKTGTKVPATPYQMATYGHAINQMCGRLPAWGDWWMCKDGGASKPFDLTPYTWDVVAEWYHKMDQGVKAERFPATGEGCFTCVVKPFCATGSNNPIPWPPVD